LMENYFFTCHCRRCSLVGLFTAPGI
jgi:hypothetical protein